MFKVNDYVVYGSTGVCQITDISKNEYTSDNETEYYVLHPVFSNNMTIMIPVNNTKVVMRAIITKDAVASLLASIPEQETIWIDDERERVNNFKAALKTGESEEWFKIIKTLHLEKEAKSVIGKKLTKTDEDIMNTAEKQLYEEFALALNISPDEVSPYIHEHISKAIMQKTT
ncbi:MAG: CarD family transcriptional regulator [Methylocystaceae bacterium]